MKRIRWHFLWGVAILLGGWNVQSTEEGETFLAAPTASAEAIDSVEASNGVDMVVGNASSASSSSEAETDRAGEPAESRDHAQARVHAIGEVTVTGKIVDETAANMPAVVESLTAEGIERINAIDTSDVFKYMPGSYLRKLYPGSTNSPLVIRGNSSFMTARTQVLMDGIQVSDFLAAGHSNSPKWHMVAPQEIEQVDVIYGPYSAALGGNSLSGTAVITTHFPQKREIQAEGQYFYQHYREYRTTEDLHGYTAFGSYGDKLGNLSVMVWYDRLHTGVQPISYVTRAASAGGDPTGNPVGGWESDKDPEGKSRYILGTPGEKELINDTFKVKLSYDLTPRSQIRLHWLFWDSVANDLWPETYLRGAEGNAVYAGSVDIDGQGYRLGSSTFGYQKAEKQDLLYGLTYSLDASSGLKISAVASYYDKFKDLTRASRGEPPQSRQGGTGQVTDGEGGWYTGDLKASYDFHWLGAHTVGGGYHFDHYFTDSETWNASDWRKDIRTTLSQGSKGKTETHALFVDDTWQILDPWSVYVGARYEWWKGFDGAKAIDGESGRIRQDLDDKHEQAFSPKFSTTFKPSSFWRLRFSLALAERFPTIGELYYGGINAQGVINNANPDLKPEKVFAKDFTVTRLIGDDGEARLTFFQDDVRDAINSQTNSYTNVTNYQNVDEVRTRGIELAVNKRRFFVDGLGIFANLAWTESKILRNDTVPESNGKTFPRVPAWRVKCVVDYAPSERWFATLAMHYGSKPFNTLTNTDEGGGYGGVDDFLVFDAKVAYRFLESLTAAAGINNITDELYHVSHPYPRRTFFASLKYTY